MTQLQSINPATGEVVGTVEATTDAELTDMVTAARAALPGWSATSVRERVELINAIANDLIANRDELAAIQTSEMGMPISASRFNVERAAAFFRWYAEHAEENLSPVVTYEDGSEIHTVYRAPRGVHVAIFPWNFPSSNMTWACGQSLLSGNAVLLKMSEEVPLTALAFEKVLNKHLADGAFRVVIGDGQVGARLLREQVDFVTFTGSTETGRSVYRVASERLLPAMMELGGSAPGIVCEHVDLDNMAAHIATARLGNAGQRCDGLKRLIVHESIFDDTVARLADIFRGKIVGDPRDELTEIGPLAAMRQLFAAREQVIDALDKGAKIIEGDVPDDSQSGAFVKPTILIDVTRDMKIWNEEVFAPILPVISYSDDAQAMRMANDSEYGLGSHIYCNQPTHAEFLTNGIETAMVSVNGAIYTRPWNPFGGVKCSGFGREHGSFGFHEMTIPKVVAKAKA